MSSALGGYSPLVAVTITSSTEADSSGMGIGGGMPPSLDGGPIGHDDRHLSGAILDMQTCIEEPSRVAGVDIEQHEPCGPDDVPERLDREAEAVERRHAEQ